MSAGNREEKQKAWSIDQLTKSAFFHQKLHQWKLLEVAEAIENIRGETLDWQLQELNISEKAWNKVIHRGIKPIIVFAHPYVLETVQQATSYYRMLAMVSQKSMGQIGLATTAHEQTNNVPKGQKIIALCRRVNMLVSNLIETDEVMNIREFDLWRGMAAGAQAQGSWVNLKGKRAEVVIKGMIYRRLVEKNLIGATSLYDENHPSTFTLYDSRAAVYADEPDIAFIKGGKTEIAIEIKGGIDAAAVLERFGAAIKSLSRAKHQNPTSLTILIMQAVSVTRQAIDDLKANEDNVSYWFTVEEILEDEARRNFLFHLLEI